MYAFFDFQLRAGFEGKRIRNKVVSFFDQGNFAARRYDAVGSDIQAVQFGFTNLNLLVKSRFDYKRNLFAVDVVGVAEDKAVSEHFSFFQAIRQRLRGIYKLGCRRMYRKLLEESSVLRNNYRFGSSVSFQSERDLYRFSRCQIDGIGACYRNLGGSELRLVVFAGCAADNRCQKQCSHYPFMSFWFHCTYCFIVNKFISVI